MQARRVLSVTGRLLSRRRSQFVGFVALWLNGIEPPRGLRFVGVPRITNLGSIVLGPNITICSGPGGNPVGGSLHTSITVKKNALVSIGANTGISNTEIYAAKRVDIGERVLVGGGVRIYDTDFHSLIANDRALSPDPGVRSSPVSIGDDVFLGAFSIVLKGVTIGNGSVIGAGSVVSKDIPPNQVWAGNPIRFVRSAS